MGRFWPVLRSGRSGPRPSPPGPRRCTTGGKHETAPKTSLQGPKPLPGGLRDPKGKVHSPGIVVLVAAFFGASCGPVPERCVPFWPVVHTARRKLLKGQGQHRLFRPFNTARFHTDWCSCTELNHASQQTEGFCLICGRQLGIGISHRPCLLVRRAKVRGRGFGGLLGS